MRSLVIAAVVLLGACTRLDLEVVGAQRVEGGPPGAAIDCIRHEPVELHHVRIDFRTTPSLDTVMRPNMRMFYVFTACDDPKRYEVIGQVHADPGRAGVFNAYIPAHFSNLPYWPSGEGHGLLGRGWPADMQSQRLCMRVRGGLMWDPRVDSGPVEVEGVGSLFTPDTERAGPPRRR